MSIPRNIAQADHMMGKLWKILIGKKILFFPLALLKTSKFRHGSDSIVHLRACRKCRIPGPFPAKICGIRIYNFNKTPSGFVCTLMFEKACFTI